MPRFPKRTAAVAVNHLLPDDDDDNDICPVCDGDCTCNNRPHPLLPNVGNGSAHFVATPTASTVSAAHALGAQPLKIKLTVPPSIQNKARSLTSAPKKSLIEDSPATSNGVAGSNPVPCHLTSASPTAGHGQHSLSDAAGQKRKGRLPKAVAIVRARTANVASNRKNRGNEDNTPPQSQSHLSSHTHAQRSVTSPITRPQAETSKSNSAASRQTSKFQVKGTIAKKSAFAEERDSLSDLTDSDLQPNVGTSHDDDDGDDASSGRFPTFVSADGLTSEASDSSDSDSDSDTSGFGSDSSLAAEEENYIVAEQRRHDKARLRRELLGDDIPRTKDPNNNWVIRPRKKSVGLSDVDMEGDTDDITEEEEEEEEEMEEDEEDDETDGRASRGYAGLVTGWSDDEESSFDADLFFANLTDTSSDDGSSDSDGVHLHESATDPLANSVTSLQNVDFEVTEAWDGQVVFTNGSNDGHGALDLAFEANAAQLLASDSASISHDSDVEMRTSNGADGDFDDGDSELGESDGDTTEEELVDEQGLPTSRAMRLFRWPISVSSINPMSTVSPNVSPAPFSRRQPQSTTLESPRPADILAGKVFWEETNESQPDSAEGSAGESPRPVVGGGMPIMGQFSLEGNFPHKTTILTGANKGVPSPYSRLGHRRRRFSSSAGSFSSLDLRGRTARLSILPSLPPPLDEPSSETPPDIGLGEPIKLDDVLDSTFLDSEPEMGMLTIPDSEGEQKLAQNLSRWDRVPVDAFRLTRESAASASDVPTSPGWNSEPSVSETRSYGSVLKSSPLHAMLWNEKSGAADKSRKSREVITSPVLLPVRDGDRTPTHIPYHDDPHSNRRQQQHTPFKSRKESRREMRMMKRKTHAPNHSHYDHHQRHYRRNHHPNMKSRGSASVQRTFFSSPTSAPALNT